MLSRALAILDEETRSLLWLKEGEGLEVKELSRIFGLPEGTVKSRLSRGREKMQKWIEKEAAHAV
jgi:RNA polymerase sigma-70 factor (ECF subfamily)